MIENKPKEIIKPCPKFTAVSDSLVFTAFFHNLLEHCYKNLFL